MLAAHLGHENAARVTVDDLRAWRQALLADGRTVSTADNYLSNVRILFRWAADGGRLPVNPAEGLRLGGVKPKAGERRLPFSDEEARLILEKARGLGGADRWIPWLLAFTGARVEEVAQALVADVRERDGIAYLDINAEGGGKSLKNAGSARRVPLHPALVAEGFLDYVQGLPPEGPLFPDLKPGPFGDRSAAYSKRAGRWLRGLGITDGRKVANHSWRHRFKDVCRDAGVAKDVHDRLTGHSEGDVSGGYGSGHALGRWRRRSASCRCRPGSWWTATRDRGAARSSLRTAATRRLSSAPPAQRPPSRSASCHLLCGGYARPSLVAASACATALPTASSAPMSLFPRSATAIESCSRKSSAPTATKSRWSSAAARVPGDRSDQTFPSRSPSSSSISLPAASRNADFLNDMVNSPRRYCFLQ